MRYCDLERFSAWCCGVSYDYPNRFVCLDGMKCVSLWIDDICLGNFYFKHDIKYERAKSIAKKAVKIGLMLSSRKDKR